MHYTQDGSEPTESDPTIEQGWSIPITHSQTLKVKAWKAGWSSSAVAAAVYEMKVAMPSLSVGSGTYATAISVTVMTATADAVLRYTLDGSDPTSTSPQYVFPITVDHTTTLKAAAFKSDWSDSNITSGVYAIQLGTLGAPTVDPRPTITLLG